MMMLNTAMQVYPVAPARIDKLLYDVLKNLRHPDPGSIVGNQDQELILQATENAQLIMGQEVPVLPEHAHSVHIQVIDMLLNNPGIGQMPPEAIDALMQHRDQHEQFMAQAGNAAARSSASQQQSGNVYETESGTAANQARRATALERERGQAQNPGTGGELF